jgi:hypothetical protein
MNNTMMKTGTLIKNFENPKPGTEPGLIIF